MAEAGLLLPFSTLADVILQSITSQSKTYSGTTIQPSNTAVRPKSLYNLDIRASSVPSSISSPSQFSLETATYDNMSNIFIKIDDDPPPKNIPRVPNHPLERKGIAKETITPIETNKFYANFFLGNQGQSVWTHPYSLQWSKGSGNAQSWGLSISHIDRSQIAIEPEKDPSRFYLNPIGIQSIILSAKELGPTSSLTTSSHLPFSANAHLSAANNSRPLITFPLVQGMGFITGVYRGAQPLIQSSVFFHSLNGPTVSETGMTAKYSALLCDGKTWYIYVTPFTNYNKTCFTMLNNTTIRGDPGFNGIIQVAKSVGSSTDKANAAYDRSAGVYAVSTSISGIINGDTGTYKMEWTKQGDPQKPLLMFALPHHLNSFSNSTRQARTAIQLQTTTKGLATAVLSDKWTLEEPHLPIYMSFEPHGPTNGYHPRDKPLPPSAIAAINNAATSELNQDISAQTNLDSMYFSGKGLAKFAFILVAVHGVVGNKQLAMAGLKRLKEAFDIFVQNQQRSPLVYEESWRGVISKAGFVDPGADFGNTYYNDHHFHYCYL
jgi:endo-1,3(4)-beta-glucanase